MTVEIFACHGGNLEGVVDGFEEAPMISYVAAEVAVVGVGEGAGGMASDLNTETFDKTVFAVRDGRSLEVVFTGNGVYEVKGIYAEGLVRKDNFESTIGDDTMIGSGSTIIEEPLMLMNEVIKAGNGDSEIGWLFHMVCKL